MTKRPTATIDLRKALAVEDDQDPNPSETPARGRRSRDRDDDMVPVERSFRLVFEREDIMFFADTDAEKAAWYVVFSSNEPHSRVVLP